MIQWMKHLRKAFRDIKRALDSIEEDAVLSRTLVHKQVKDAIRN